MIARGVDDDVRRHGQDAELDQVCRARLARALVRRGLDDADALTECMAAAVWRRISSGHVVTDCRMDESRLWTVVLGRVEVRADGSGAGVAFEVLPGELIPTGGDGAVVMVATRDTVLAGLPRIHLQRLAVPVRELAVAGAGGSGVSRRPPSRRATVLAVVVAPELDRRYVTSRIASGLQALGPVETLWPARVDVLLSTPGIAQRERGEPGDLDVGVLLEDVEAEAETVVLEVGTDPDAWSRRALAAADRVVVVVRASEQEGSDERVRRVADFAPPGVPRHLVVLRRDERAPVDTARRLDATGCQYAHHVLGDAVGDVARVGRVLAGRGRGLVLSGGGARGFAHLGVQRALAELGIEVDLFAGSSIGSPLAAGMADEIPPEEFETVVEQLFAKVLDYTVPVVALTSGRRIATATRQVFGHRHVEDLRRGFLAVSTDLTTATPHVHRRGPLASVVRASCAIPGVMPPVPHDGHLLVDGGVTNNLPVDVLAELAPEGELLAVDVVPPSGPRARQDYGLWVSGWGAVRHRVRHGRSLPAMAATILRALTVASEQRRNGGSGPPLACHLALDLRGVSMLDFGAVRAVARRGYEQAMPALEAWLEGRGSGQDEEEVGDAAARVP